MASRSDSRDRGLDEEMADASIDEEQSEKLWDTSRFHSGGPGIRQDDEEMPDVTDHKLQRNSLPVDSSRHGPVPPHSKLNTFVIQIEHRNGDRQRLSDKPQSVQWTPTTMLLLDEYEYLQTDRLRASHFSWDKFCVFVHKAFGFDFAPATCELGFVAHSPEPGLPSEYFIISSASAFMNTISVMINDYGASAESSTLILHLWNPIPKEPVNPRTRLRRDLGTSTSIQPRDTGVAARPKLNISDSNTSTISPDGDPTDPWVPTPSKGDAAVHDETQPPDDTGDVVIDLFNLEKKYEHGKIPDVPVRGEDESEDEFYNRVQSYMEDLKKAQIDSLQAGLNSKVTMHLDPEIWKEVCSFFHHTILKPEPEYEVAVPSFKRKLLPVQAHGVWWALHYGIHSAQYSIILAHIPGIGKTTMAYAIHSVQHTINRMWDQIKKDPTNHYNSSHSNNPLEWKFQGCPNNKLFFETYGFDCPCWPSSTTHKVKEKLGVSVALVPKGLLTTWTEEHEACFGSSKDLDSCPLLARAHERSLTSRELSMLRGEEEEFVEGEDGEEEIPAPSAFAPRLENGRIFVITTSQSFESRFLVPTQTNRSWLHQPPPYEKKKRNGQSSTVQPNAVRKYTHTYPTSIVSMLFQDEFHREKNPGSYSIKVLQQLQNRQSRPNYGTDEFMASYTRYWISIIPMSGTPLSVGPGDIASWIEQMVRPWWKDDPVLKKWIKQECVELSSQWAKMCKKASGAWKTNLKDKTNQRDTVSLEAIKATAQSLQPLVELLFIRFDVDSNFLGHKCVKVPKAIFIERNCENSPDWSKVVEGVYEETTKDFEKREQKRKDVWVKRYHSLDGYEELKRDQINSYYRARICSIIPGLAHLKDKQSNSPLRLTEKEWRDHTTAKELGADDEDSGYDEPPLAKWTPETSSDPYYSAINTLAESSAKFQAVEKDIEEMDRMKDVDDRQPRMIWMTYFYVAAYCFYLWMVHVRKVPKEEIIFVHPLLSEKKKELELAKFHGNPDSDDPEKKVGPARFIIATSSALGFGVTLAEASSCALLEPDFRPATMIQVLGRHCRQGNRNPKVFSMVYYTNSTVENHICTVNRLRETIISAAKRTANAEEPKSSDQAQGKARNADDSPNEA